MGNKGRESLYTYIHICIYIYMYISIIFPYSLLGTGTFRDCSGMILPTVQASNISEGCGPMKAPEPPFNPGPRV